jgi:signal transduction histidine kinase
VRGGGKKKTDFAEHLGVFLSHKMSYILIAAVCVIAGALLFLHRDALGHTAITIAALCIVLLAVSVAILHIYLLANRRLKNVTSHLLHTEKMASLGMMVAGLSHELDTPLGIAVSASSQIDEIAQDFERLFRYDEVSEEEVMDLLFILKDSSRIISSHLKHSNQIIRQFMATASDLYNDERVNFTLWDMFQELLIDMRHLFRDSNIGIELSCPTYLRMHGFAGALRHVMYNLYDGAVNHGFSGGEKQGTINIDCALVDEQIKIVFSDDGCGMDLETQKHIFEPFFTTARGKGGVGLGLFIVHELVTKTLSGAITCASEPGVGTTFEILMPYTPPLKKEGNK